jgi:hypothetical protein
MRVCRAHRSCVVLACTCRRHRGTGRDSQPEGRFKMKAYRLMAMVVATWAGLAIGGEQVARAQGGGPANLQYTPRPTVSPYLNLFNEPTGVGVYQTLVRPFLQQNDFNARAATNINQLQQELNQVRSGSGLGVTGTAGRIRPTGHAATYMDFSHYYAGGRR